MSPCTFLLNMSDVSDCTKNFTSLSTYYILNHVQLFNDSSEMLPVWWSYHCLSVNHCPSPISATPGSAILGSLSGHTAVTTVTPHSGTSTIPVLSSTCVASSQLQMQLTKSIPEKQLHIQTTQAIKTPITSAYVTDFLNCLISISVLLDIGIRLYTKASLFRYNKGLVIYFKRGWDWSWDRIECC